MRRFRGTSPGFLLAEFVVISLGVLVALGADRWARGLDEKTHRNSYLASLQTDLRQDSVNFVMGETDASRSFSHAGLLLSVLRDGPGPTTDRKKVIVALGELSDFLPRGFRTGTWTDLLATGNLRLLDADLRRKLAFYYDMQPDRINSDAGQEPFRRYASIASHLLKPEQRMMALELRYGTGPDSVSSVWESVGLPDPGFEVSTATTMSDGVFAALIDRLEATPDLEAILGDILWASMFLKVEYELYGGYNARLLADPHVAGAAPRDTASS